MSKVYTIAFRMGVLFNVLLWTIFNVVSYQLAANESARNSHGITFSPCCRMIWGFPFAWDKKYFVIEGAGTILNIIIMTICGFAFGFLFKFVWSKISQRGVQLK